MNRGDEPLRILAFEPFDTGSHRAVRRSISRHSRHEWTWFTRPGRAWKWRMRLAAPELTEQARAAGALDRPIDAIFASSLLSSADLIALLPPALRTTPVVLYMHENQAAYPAGREKPETIERDVHFALTNLTSVLSADLVVFNSQWNRWSFIEGIRAVLAHAPDSALGDVRGRITARSRVIWPPVEPPPEAVQELRRTGASPGKSAAAARDGGASSASPSPVGARALHNPIRIVWPHRWEHDKRPEELLELAARHSESLNLRWTILGEQFRESPPALAEFQQRFAERIDHVGYVEDRDAYWRHLARADWVLSTAGHEFFGIAVVEALLAGCLPWLPDRLSYPELLPAEAHGLSPARPPNDPDAVHSAICAHLEPALAQNAVRRLDEAIASLHAECAGGASNSGN